ncbi:GspE/PulE family protein [Loktanella sp. Alg231-35]|uniref:GspE/PulE family protein n=1 Tax=Loktanella sp. Alg231-35 TaxID=1922220 RepID=UPI000D55D8BA|nr:GspE/PulE family protein [Loktanella sp. Alg231-35]
MRSKTLANPLQSFDETAFLAFLADQALLPEITTRRVSIAANETGISVMRAVLELGLLEEDAAYAALASHLGVSYLTFDELDHGLLHSGLLKFNFMKRSLAIPVAQGPDGYVIATSDPKSDDILASIAYLLDAPVRRAIASPTTIKAALEMAETKDQDRAEGANQSDVARLEALANDGPVITLVNDIIGKAVSLGASDVHVETQERGARVRYRVDGVLQNDRAIPDDLRSAVASRLKVMANLNISERRRPQDGRADIVVRGRSIDIRMSSMPTQHGESIVLRLLDRSRMQLDWKSLKFPPERVAEIEQLMACPNGIFLVAGPTGSGKTTTLYTALRGINSEDRKIVTVEDPIEYALEGVNQVQVDPAIDMSFAKALRAILRQDPNVMMVGEIRDEETAEIAVRAALIGRLVLSTIHTNDAISAVDRLLDLGIAPYLVGATLRGVLSQRLVRTTCESCHGGGCGTCNTTGKQGGMAVSELLRMTPDLSEAIAQGGRGSTLLTLAQKDGFVGIAAQTHALVEARTISLDEAHRALGLD